MVRITQNLLNRQALYNLQQSMSRLTKVQNTLSTGKAISTTSDNPVAYNSALSLRTTIEQNHSYQKSIATSESNLELTESTLNSLTETLQDIRDMAVQGASDIGSDARLTLADQVSELYDYIFDLANTEYNGQSLFGGSSTKEDAFVVKGDAVLYQGDDYQRQVYVSTTSKITTNVTGMDTFLHTSNEITGSVSIDDVDAPLSEQLALANPNFPNLPTIPDKPEESTTDPSPNSENYPTELPNQYASFTIYDTEIKVDLSADSLQDVVNRINATVEDVEASIDDQNRLVITSKRSDDLELSDGEIQIGFEGDTPNGVNLMSALGMNRQIDGTRSLTQGYPASNPLVDGTTSPAPERSAVKVEAESYLFVGSNTGPDSESSVPFPDNLALTNVDEEGNDVYLDTGDPDFIENLEALRITIDDEVIDVDLRGLTEGYSFDEEVGNEDDVPGSSLGDLLELINNHPQLQGKVTAYINADGTGIGISAVSSADVFTVENVRCLFGRDITQQVEIDPVTGEETVTQIDKLTLETKLEDIPGALVDSTSGSLGIRHEDSTVLGTDSGLNQGLISITNDGESEVIDLREAVTINDVIDAINDSSVGVEARINEAGTGIDIISLKTGDGELSVVDLYDGTTARDLGLFQVAQPTRIQSTGGLVATDAIGTRFPTAGSGKFEIEVRDSSGAVMDTYSIDVDASLPDGDTLESLVAKIDEADGEGGAGGGLISASISNGTINIVSNYNGTTISIDSSQDTTGTDATNQLTQLLGIDQYTYTTESDSLPITPYVSKQNTASILGVNQEGTVNEVETQNVFETVKNLITALRNNDTDAISEAMSELDIDLEAVLNQRTIVGSRLNRLTALQSDLAESEDLLSERLSLVEDADLAESVIDLSTAQNAYNAALQASSLITQQSLLDFLG